MGNAEAGTDPHQLVATWGVGGQLRTVGGLYVVGELFSGDPYVPGTGTAYQTSFRYFVSPLMHVDATVGQGPSGARAAAVAGQRRRAHRHHPVPET